VAVSYTPQNLNFGGVAPGSGPDISVDPSSGPPAISFAGGVSITEVPANAVVTTTITGDTAHVRIRDVTVLEWMLEPVDGGELPPGHHGPPPKVRVLEIVNQTDGSAPVTVTAGQFLLVRVEYDAPQADGSFTGTLVIQGSTWQPIQVPLSCFVALVQTQFDNTPVILPRGTTQHLIMTVNVLFGPPTNVTWQQSPIQQSSGITILPAPPFAATRAPTDASLGLQVAIDAPLGDNSLLLNQFAWSRTGFAVPVTVTQDPQPDIARVAIARKAAERQNVLGSPTSQVIALQGADGTVIPDTFVQHFQAGDIYYSPATDAHEVHGDIVQKYDALGGPLGELGFPVTDGITSGDPIGTASHFQAGAIYSHPQIGPRMVRGDIMNTWLAAGGILNQDYGYPTRDEHQLRVGEHIDDPNPNIPILWSTFENGAIAKSQRGIDKARVATVTPDHLTAFIRKRFDENLKKVDSDLGLDPGVQIVKVLGWDYDPSQSTGRAIVLKLTGFHSNPVIGDTTFSITMGLRLGWKLSDTPPDPASRTMLASLLPNTLVVDASGAGADQAKQGLIDGIQKQFASPMPVADVPLIAPILGIQVWTVADLIITAEGGLLLLLNPSPSESTLAGLIQGGAQSALDQMFGGA
jgi:hypothetical protein